MDEVPTEIRLQLNEYDRWIATDELTHIASQGGDREEVLMKLDDAYSLHVGDIGIPIEHVLMEEIGLDPTDIPDTPTVPNVPWFKKRYID